MAGDIKVLFAAVLFIAVLCDVEGCIRHIPTRVQIVPSLAARGQTVELQCNFTLPDEDHIPLMTWVALHTTNEGKYIFGYWPGTGASFIFDDYQRKIISSEYLENVGGELDRRHMLRMRVDDCDAVTYFCQVEVWTTWEFLSKVKPKSQWEILSAEEMSARCWGSETLDINGSLPEPEICLEIDGRCQSGSVFRESITTVIVRCVVNEASVEPDITVKREGADIPVRPITKSLGGCLKNFSVETGEQVADFGIETTFRCEVNYGGRRKVTQAAVTLIIGSCGVPAIKRQGYPVISGGTPAEPHTWPWQVSLREKEFGGHICGGSLISNNFVITAAHCLPRNGTEMYLGAHDRTVCTAPACRTVTVTDVWRHPNYTVLRRGISNNDLTIVKFSPAVQFTDTISPVCLPDSSDVLPAGTVCYITGWGNLGPNEPAPLYLHELPLELWPQRNCSRSLPRNFMANSMLCARNSRPAGRGACLGDSGGPLVCTMPGENQWKLFAITSWGPQCGHPRVPGAYVRVVSYVEWINDILWELHAEPKHAPREVKSVWLKLKGFVESFFP